MSRGLGDVYKRQILPGEQQEYLQKIQKKTEYLTQLINEFSYYSKLDYTAFELGMTRIDLCGFVREFMAENYDYITNGGFEVSVDIPDNIYWCMIDTTHFRRCLENLLSNFMKYNPEESLIHAAVYDAGESYSVVLENNGTPIAPEIAMRLFEPFVMGDKSRSSGKGSGLGLAVVRKIVELHGGSIQYLTKQKYANSFRISLPK